MAGKAISAEINKLLCFHSVDFSEMTVFAGNIGVFSLKFEVCFFMVESDFAPTIGRMTGFTVIIGVEPAVEVVFMNIFMTTRALFVHIPKIPFLSFFVA